MSYHIEHFQLLSPPLTSLKSASSINLFNFLQNHLHFHPEQGIIFISVYDCSWTTRTVIGNTKKESPEAIASIRPSENLLDGGHHKYGGFLF
jgi:hypothetical protein